MSSCPCYTIQALTHVQVAERRLFHDLPADLSRLQQAANFAALHQQFTSISGSLQEQITVLTSHSQALAALSTGTLLGGRSASRVQQLVQRYHTLHREWQQLHEDLTLSHQQQQHQARQSSSKSAEGEAIERRVLLLLEQQPPPHVVGGSASTVVEGSYLIRLLCAPSLMSGTAASTTDAVRICGPAQALLVYQERQALHETEPVAQRPLRYVGPPECPQLYGVAEFDEVPAQLRGKRQFCVRFRIPVAVGRHEFFACSPLSLPMESTIHTNQWLHAAADLLQLDVFASGAPAVQWAHFANALQRHFVKATRQRVDDPPRSLCIGDCEYLRLRFCPGGDAVTIAALTEEGPTTGDDDTPPPGTSGKTLASSAQPTASNTLWGWLGHVVREIRFKKDVNALWLNGCIAPFFVGRAEAEQLLTGAQPGTFIVRFSESQAGSFVLSFVERSP